MNSVTVITPAECTHYASPCQQLSALSDPLMTSAFARPLPFQSDISFSKNPLHSTLIETLNVYLIQLKTERCHQFRGVY